MKTIYKNLAAVLALTLLMFTSEKAFPQQDKFGISINSLTTNFNYGSENSSLSDYKKDYRGFQFGLTFQHGLSKSFSLVHEISFTIKGGKLGKGNPVFGNETTLRFHGLEVPLLARLHMGNLYLNAGPYAGYQLGGRIKTKDAEDGSESTTKVKFGSGADQFKRWDFGMQAGAGYNFQLKRSILTLDVRYGYGLQDLSVDRERFNRMLNISVVVSRPGK